MLMKRILAPFLFLSVALVSCAKEDSFEIPTVKTEDPQPGGYHLSFDDGSGMVKYDGNAATATRLPYGGGTNFTIMGGTMSKIMSIVILSIGNTDLVAGTTYKSTETVDGFDTKGMLTFSVNEFYESTATSSFEVYISAISNTEIAGTFKGTLIDPNNNQTKNINSGSFRVKFQ